MDDVRLAVGLRNWSAREATQSAIKARNELAASSTTGRSSSTRQLLAMHSRRVSTVLNAGLLSTLVAALGLLATALFRLDGKIEGLGTGLGGKIDALDARLSGKIDALDARLGGKIDALDARLSSRIDATNARIDRLIGQTHQS
jgi:hypothetical protein